MCLSQVYFSTFAPPFSSLTVLCTVTSVLFNTNRLVYSTIFTGFPLCLCVSVSLLLGTFLYFAILSCGEQTTFSWLLGHTCSPFVTVTHSIYSSLSLLFSSLSLPVRLAVKRFLFTLSLSLYFCLFTFSLTIHLTSNNRSPEVCSTVYFTLL